MKNVKSDEKWAGRAKIKQTEGGPIKKVKSVLAKVS